LNASIEDRNFYFERKLIHSHFHVHIDDIVEIYSDLTVDAVKSSILLAPEFCTVTTENGCLICSDVNGNCLFIKSDMDIKIYNGSENPFYGWHAPCYGQRLKCIQLVFFLNKNSIFEGSIDIQYKKITFLH